MNDFTYWDGELMAEDVSVRALADTYGTPLYIYSRAHLLRQLHTLNETLREVSPLLCFAVKSNSNGAVIRTLALAGAGADVVSGGELSRARRAGVAADKIVFAGVGKTVEEIDYALREGILFFTVESEPEIERLSDCAARIRCGARIALRVNPDVDPQTHRFTSTGKKIFNWDGTCGLDDSKDFWIKVEPTFSSAPTFSCKSYTLKLRYTKTNDACPTP